QIEVENREVEVVLVHLAKRFVHTAGHRRNKTASRQRAHNRHANRRVVVDHENASGGRVAVLRVWGAAHHDALEARLSATRTGSRTEPGPKLRNRSTRLVVASCPRATS